MIKLETDINTVLQQLKSELADVTWESRRRYFNQMLRLAKLFNITEPCQELYNAFVVDDNGSKERRSLHIYCARLLDAAAGTKAKDEHGTFYNEQPIPNETKVLEFFQNQSYPLSSGMSIDYLIVKAKFEMQYLNLSNSTIGQYRHSWMDMRRYFITNGITDYDESLILRFIHEICIQHNNGSMKEWKWKINRKAAYVLKEVAETGCFHWGMIQKAVSCNSTEIEAIRLQYQDFLMQKNLSKSTVSLHDYVFRKTIDFSKMNTLGDLYYLSPGQVQRTIIKFAEVCGKRSMATILPILRSLIQVFYTKGWIEKDLSGMVMSGFIQKGSVATYITVKDETKLIAQLDREPKRNKAIILLAFRLGLRDCDICKLTFNEIDWSHDRLRIIQKKTGEPLVLPLLPDVGNALMDYIMNERPQRQDCYPYVFLRRQAPYTKLTSIYSTCSKLLAKLKIKPVNGTKTGAHLFRYSMVHRLLAAKVPHQVITDILGHTSKESDKPYLSMEESMLKMCALDLSVIGKISWEVMSNE
ncbi:MAG: tyrosine-type recombinase/integrase [Firmicutes bacterium]|nr:tyrosine-type recombinase/integrase [Bacillota bacterium]